MIEIGGFTPMSTADWPGQLAAVVFVQGCPWRCRYCHNPELQPRQSASDIDWPTVASTLARRVGLLDGVVFSGGEPTIAPALAQAVDHVGALGLQVGLHTAGIYPRRLAELLPRLQWVGFDVKTNFADYDGLTGRRGSGAAPRRALDHLLASGVPHELRTTYHPALVDDEALRATARSLAAAGAKAWVLQRWRPVGAGDAALARSWRWPDQALLEELGSEGLTLSLR